MRKIGWRVSIKSQHCNKPVIIECGSFTLTPILSLVFKNVKCVKIGTTDVTGVLQTNSKGHITITTMRELFYQYQSILL